MKKYYLGIDPSTTSTGYAVFDNDGSLVDYGVIQPDDSLMPHQKILFEYNKLKEITEKYAIAGVCSEEQFGKNNVSTLKKLCQVTGIVMLLAAELGVLFTFKYPASWRKHFHGIGNVKKKDTVKLVNDKYDLKLRLKDNDIADAIGLAWVAFAIGEGLIAA